MDKFSKVLVSVAAASVLASGAMASGLVFAKYKSGTGANKIGENNVTILNASKTIKEANADAFGAIKVDELLKEQSDLDINSTDATSWKGTYNSSTRYNRMLAYYSDADLAKYSTLRFKINCGMIEKTGDLKLYAWDINKSKFVPVTMNLVDFKTSTKGAITGYTEVRFKLNASDYKDDVFATYDGTASDPVVNGTVPAGSVLVFGQEVKDGNITKLMLVPIKGDKCGCVCDTSIEMTEAKDDNGQDLSAPMVSGVTPLITYTKGLKAVVKHRNWSTTLVKGNADSWIDTTEGVDRKKFIPEADGNLSKSDTSALTSEFFIDIDDESEYGLALDGNDAFTLNVNRAIYCAVKDVTVEDNAGTKHKLIKNSAGAYEIAGKFNSYNFDGTNPIDINVNGTDVICPGMWRVSLEIDPNENGVDNFKLLDVANAADWRIKAMQFIIPYLNTDPNYGTYIVITNMGDKSAPVFFDAYGDSGKNAGAPSSAYYTNIKLGDIPKRSTRIYFPKDMNKAIKAKFPAWNANRYLAKFYVVADENNIEAAAFQKDGNNGKRSIPVLTTSFMNHITVDFDTNTTSNYYWGHKFHE